MKTAEKNTESFSQTIKRTIITTTIIAIILFWSRVFPSNGKSALVLFSTIWSVAFCIVFGGHWLELLFVNQVKFLLPKNILLLYFARICYWFVCSIPLFFLATLVNSLFSNRPAQFGFWWAFGFIYIGIQLLMYAIMHARLGKSFYDGAF